MLGLLRPIRRFSGALSALLVVGGVSSLRADAQESAPLPAAGLQQLRAEVSCLRPLSPPNRPVWVRFSLINPTDQTIELPYVGEPAAGDAAGLPLALVLGPESDPSLWLSFGSERPVPVRPGVGIATNIRTSQPGTAESPAQQVAEPADSGGSAPEPVRSVLRIGPRAVVGTLIDLREAHSALRYQDRYRIEWRPLGGAISPAAAVFRIESRKDAVLITDVGKIRFALRYDEAPLNVDNFVELVRDEFYRGKTLHRIVPGYLIQGGCPHGTGLGIRPDGKLVPAEFDNTPVDLGTLCMARKPSDPNSASCQFFIALGRHPELDGQYTVIGHATDPESLRTLELLATVETDAEYRPARPPVIRHFTLVEAEEAPPVGIEARRQGGSAPADRPQP